MSVEYAEHTAYLLVVKSLIFRLQALQLFLNPQLKYSILLPSLHVVSVYIWGPAWVALRSEVLPLTASCLSQPPGFKSWLGHVRELPVTWGLELVFAEYSGFLPRLQLVSHDLSLKVTIIEIPNFKFSLHLSNFEGSRGEETEGGQDSRRNSVSESLRIM